jgi:hypothetical protein
MSQTARTFAPPRTRKLLLAIHIAFVGSWLGATVAMTFLSALGLLTSSAELRAAAYLIMSRMDTGLIVPLVIASIASGALLAVRTPWGLFQYRWIMAKIGIALAMVAFAVSTVMQWVQSLAAATAVAHNPANLAPTSAYLMASAILFVTGLWAIVFIAVYKPWARHQRSK